MMTCVMMGGRAGGRRVGAGVGGRQVGEIAFGMSGRWASRQTCGLANGQTDQTDLHQGRQSESRWASGWLDMREGG